MSFSDYSAQPTCPHNARTQKTRSTPSTDKVIASFNTWAFKREQPSDVDLLSNIVRKQINNGSPIQFVLYWGKGPRNRTALPDLQCLDYLMAFADRVKSVYEPGAHLTLIYTDTHAALNGHSAANTQQYFAGIEAAAAERGFGQCRLGDLVRKFRSRGSHEADHSGRGAMLSNLTRSASRWYRGGGDAEAGAVAYYDMNMVEKHVIEAAFPQSIFVTFNGSDLRALFPDNLPIFYMYSLRKGFGVKPWFIDDAIESLAQPGAGQIA